MDPTLILLLKLALCLFLLPWFLWFLVAFGGVILIAVTGFVDWVRR